MKTHDVIQIVDAYSRHHDGHRRTMKNDPDGEAQGLSMLVKLLGRNPRKIAILSRDDDPRLLAYQREDYEIIKMNGDRDAELRKFISKMTAEIKREEPKHTVLVSDDPEFVFLCEAAAPHTDLAVWANRETVPPELAEPNYNFRSLEELLPNLKIPRIDVRLDLENIFIGLVQQRRWQPNLRELIEAIRRAMADLGEIVTITGYADWAELARHHGGPNVDWQRDLALAGGESRYVVNQHGKNTADMKIADDIRTLVEHNAGAHGVVDVICLATMDRDFRPIVETAQRRGKRVVVLGLEGGVSRELDTAASEVRYLDKYLRLAGPSNSGAENAPSPQREDVALMLRVAAWMHRNRWRSVYRDRMELEFGEVVEDLRKVIADGWLVPSPNSPVDLRGQARKLEPNPEHTTAWAALYLARWIPSRLDYCLKQRGMPHVDTNYLASGMTRDTTLSRMGVGQTRKAAENWLYAAEAAGLVVHVRQPHPQTPERLITTWRLPEEVAATPAPEAEGAEVRDASPPSDTSHLRQLLTEGLSDGELTRLTFDYFRPVHRAVEGEPKFARIQALLDYIERCDQREQLLAAIREVNPALSGEPQTLLLAA